MSDKQKKQNTLEDAVESVLGEAVKDEPGNIGTKVSDPLDKKSDAGGPTPTKDENHGGEVKSPGDKAVNTETNANETKDTDGEKKKKPAQGSSKESTPGDSKKVEAIDIKSLFGDDETLTEDFITKAQTLVEAAVSDKVATITEEIKSRLEEENKVALTEQMETLAEQVDSYMTYLAKEFVKENEIAIDNGIRHEMMESFVSGLRDLFEKHYVDVPEQAVDIVEELASDNKKLEEKSNQLTESVIELQKKLGKYRRAELLEDISKDMTQTQREKLATLTEDYDIEDEDEFTSKSKIVAESIIKKTHTNTDGKKVSGVLSEEGTEDPDATKEVIKEAKSAVDVYADAINGSLTGMR